MKILQFKKQNIIRKIFFYILNIFLYFDNQKIFERYFKDEFYRQKVDEIYNKLYQYHYDTYLIKAEQYAEQKADKDIKEAILKNRIGKLYRTLNRHNKQKARFFNG